MNTYNDNEKSILVIPSIRENHFKSFLESWKDKGDWEEIVLIEDNSEKTFKFDSKWKVHHFSHEDIKTDLLDNSWIISRKDSACRSFGFKVARDLGAKWIVSLDDDCHPHFSIKNGICQHHLSTIYGFNTCKASAGVRTRGLPYKNLGIVDDVVCNMGLWANNGDWDSVQSLSNPNLSNYFTPPSHSFLAHPKHRYPFCGMNIFFRSDLVPCMYFPLMGKDQPYSRFDDIWAGWIFQKILSHLNFSWSIGEPWVEHQRASDPFVNLIKEASGISRNETFWQRIDGIELFGTNIIDCMKDIGSDLSFDKEEYLQTIGKAILIWCQL